MSRKAAPVPETSARAAVLDKVFGKALDVSVNALGEEVMVDSFGDLKSVYGNQMDKLFRNMIGKTQANMEASYRDICIRNDVDEGLRKLEQAPPVPSSDALLSTEDPLTSTVAELRLLEAEKLRDAIKNVSLPQSGRDGHCSGFLLVSLITPLPLSTDRRRGKEAANPGGPPQVTAGSGTHRSYRGVN